MLPFPAICSESSTAPKCHANLLPAANTTYTERTQIDFKCKSKQPSDQITYLNPLHSSFPTKSLAGFHNSNPISQPREMRGS
ncbi:hypothetical protein RchiOBHm_Chr5g0070231 [Rosa chinensis]|uniref:Uncharacterized protein n=1 Tax=Rosa chinensis TaxID=74649 RepID=A0A2P6QK44_ROSCH|nr:hypothetical protein RchiOBHm_Chr5g0070231 [Rosa chinensis]